MSDVKLVPGAVVVEAWDLRLDAADRRKNTTQFRRALVHNPDDGLTVNWGEDYPGGVTILGPVNMGAVTIHKEARITDVLTHKANVNGQLLALLNVKPGGTISRAPLSTSDEQFQSTTGGSLSQVLQMVQQGVTQEFNVKVDLVDAVATLSHIVRLLMQRLQKLETKAPA